MAIPDYRHIVVVIEENKDYSEIIGNPQAPYINSLAAGGALLDNFSAITHPSEPNYLALYAGSTFGLASDDSVSEPDPTLATILQGAGMTFAGWVEHPDTSFDHNPWESFPEGISVEQDFANFPTSDFASLPTVSFVIPNVDDDMHSGTMAQGDTWLQTNLSAYAQWAMNNNSLLAIVWDEADTSPTNQIPAILHGADVVPGDYNTAYNDYNLLSTILGAYNLTGPNNAAGAAPIAVFSTGTLGPTGPGPSSPGGGDGETIGFNTPGPVVVSAPDNPLSISSAGVVTATGTGVDGVDSSLGSATINNDGTISSATGFGISLAGSGRLNNGPRVGSAALISGSAGGIQISGAGAYIENWGSISGSNGIILQNGGAIDNRPGGAISGTDCGIFGYDTNPGTIYNYGSISSTNSAGILLGLGGKVTNASGAVINGGSDAIHVQNGAAGTVINAGTIRANAGAGVDFGNGGTITNNPGGVVSGSTYGVLLSGGAGIVSNAGTISGGSYAVKLADSAANRLVVGPGATFVGKVDGGGGTLELASGTGAIAGIDEGAFTNFQTLAIDTGASWTLTDSGIAPDVIDNGTLAIAASLAGLTIDPGSTGLFQIDAGATLDVAAAIGTQAQIGFLGSGELAIENTGLFGSHSGAPNYAGPQVDGFASGDTIDLRQFESSGTTLSYDTLDGVLQLANRASQVVSLAFQSSALDSNAFDCASDGAGGTLLTLGPDAPSPSNGSGSPPPSGVSTTTTVFDDGGQSATMIGDAGNDTFIGTTGNDTIITGTGSNLIDPGSGNDLITSNGNDTIFPGGGDDTVFAFGHVLAGVGARTLTLINGSNPSTVIGGGTGTAVINGGAGGGLFAGGTGGTNVILGGTGAATIFGSSGSDLLWAGGSQPDLLVAGSGNETLSGLGSSGNNVMYAGAGNDLLGGGSGNETFFAGAGSATMIGGSGADLFAFVNGLAGGADFVFGFNPGQGDRVSLQGYGANEVQTALANATVAGGSTTIALSDHTSITFAGITDLMQSAFT